MGNPQGFSRELPQRGQRLIEVHYNDLAASREMPLKATFLLSISMPMVMLPYERIQRAKAHMNEGPLDPPLAAAMATLSGAIKDTDFFHDDAWEYSVLPKGAGFPNLALGLPDAVAQDLDRAEAKLAAGNLSAERFLSVIRNGLAHGCALFLNAKGRTEYEAAVERYVFVSTDKMNATELRFLRVTMKSYRDFLKSWSDWLRDYGVQAAVEADVEPGADGDETEATAAA